MGDIKHQIGLAEETQWSTPVTATRFLEFTSETMARRNVYATSAGIRSGRRYLPAGCRNAGRAARTGARMPSVQEVSQRIAELTPQQARIMKLICAGKPNKQIAHELSLAEATVKAHITALLRRLGVQNRTQAAVLVESANLNIGAGLGDTDARAFLSQ